MRPRKRKAAYKARRYALKAARRSRRAIIEHATDLVLASVQVSAAFHDPSHQIDALASAGTLIQLSQGDFL